VGTPVRGHGPSVQDTHPGTLEGTLGVYDTRESTGSRIVATEGLEKIMSVKVLVATVLRWLGNNYGKTMNETITAPLKGTFSLCAGNVSLNCHIAQ